MPQGATPPRRQADRVRETRGRLIAATISALDEKGYWATSISVVQARAGVSRGALMYHFATRNDLMIATAQHVLDAAIRPTRDARARHLSSQGTLPELVRFYWRRIVNTPEGRAFVELLIACRTDADLHAALVDTFTAWEREIAEVTIATFESSGSAPDDAAILWSISRAFLRGLIVHGQFIDEADHIDRMIDRFADLLSGVLSFKDTPTEGQTNATDS